MRIHLARQGQGIVCLPDFIVAEHLHSGRWQILLEDCNDNSGTMWVVWHASPDLSPKLRAFINCLSAQGLSQGT